MKVGIITHYLHFGYGGVLQNYALQTVLKQMGHDPITLRVAVVKDNSLRNKIRSYIVRVLHSYLHRDSGITEEQDKYISRKVEVFIGKYIKCTQPNRSSNDFRNSTLSEECGALIVGSDQIWRPNFDYVSSCFLDFATNINVIKIAYAASFGVDDWRFSSKETEVYSRLAHQFDAISVREDSGISLCLKKLDRDDAKLVLDPTLLINKENYIKLTEEANENPCDGNLFTYILDKTEEKESVINIIAHKYSLKRYECMPRYSTTFENVKQHPNECVYPPITKWIRSFMDAEMVITDSFHGTVFSIIFNKPFFVLLNKDRGVARFTSLLNLFGLSERIISGKIDYDILSKEINWKEINMIKEDWANKSRSFLNAVLK